MAKASLTAQDILSMDSTYTYRSGGYSAEILKVEELIDPSTLTIQDVTEEATTRLDEGETNVVIDKVITTDPIIRNQTVDANVRYIVPVITETDWNINASIDFVTGDTTNSITGSVAVMKDGELLSGIEVGGGGNGNGNGNGNGGGKDNNNGNGNGKDRTVLGDPPDLAPEFSVIEPIPLDGIATGNPVEETIPDVVVMTAVSDPLA